MRALALTACLLSLSGCSREPAPSAPAPPAPAPLAPAPSATPTAEEKPTTYLASINVPLGPRERIESFQIDTWGVEVLAVCHIPYGWRMTGGRSATPDGVIAGEGSHGITWIGDMKALESLVLIGLYEPGVQKLDEGDVPATFKGKALVDGFDTGREVKLTSDNVRLVRAERCPEVVE